MILVTGGAGFIGSNIVKGLNDMGIEDIILSDNLSNGYKCRNMNALKFRDYIDKEELFDKLQNGSIGKPEAIIHQGACSSTTEWNGKYMMDNNYEYSKRLLTYAKANGAGFIYASSASVYGNGDNGFAEKRENENPLNVYAFSKYLFDQWVRREMEDSGIQIVGLRYFNVYGPQENHKGKMASTAWHFYHQLKKEGKTRLFEGSDKFIRDFIYIDDLVEVVKFFIEHPEKSGIYNCGTGKAESFLEIAKTLIEIEGKGGVEYIPFPDELKGKYQAFTEADTSKLREAGFDKPFRPVKEGVRDYYRYLAENEGYLFNRGGEV